MKIDSVRKEYKFSELSRKTIDKNPFSQFRKWLKEAINAKVEEPNGHVGCYFRNRWVSAKAELFC